MWIKEIRLKNYRAFGEEVVVKTYKKDAPDKRHHVLIYGENGAGKTSLYRGVRALLRSSSGDTVEAFEKNVFEPDDAAGHVGFTMSDGAAFSFEDGEIYELQSDSPLGNPDFISAAKIGGFLDYKRLLPIYTKRATDSARKNVFDLIIGSVIRNHIVTDPRDGTDRRLYEVYAELSEVLTTKRRKSWPSDEAQTQLVAFEAEVRGILDRLKIRVNRYLVEYFNNNLQIDYSLSTLGLTSDSGPKIMLEEMALLPTYANYTANHYGDFLNEARLSALALCFFLAAIKENPLGAGNLRILYLDDVFIGMDMSNRIPLLRLLRDEFLLTDEPNQFQLFLSMYDRSWYELAERWFKAEKIPAKTIEMYAETVPGEHQPDRPVILDRSSGYLIQAEAYLRAGDYAAAAMNMRKACEEKLKALLPFNRLYKVNDDGNLIRKNSLHAYLEKMEVYRKQLGIDTDLFLRLSRLKDRVLNPFSHDHHDAPFFRREIEDAIAVIKELDAVEVETLIAAENGPLERLVWSYDDRSFPIVALENLRLYRFPGQPAMLSACRCQLLDGSKLETLEKAMSSMFGRDMRRGRLDNATQYFAEITLANGRTLAEVIAP